MARPRRILLPKTIAMITARVQDGLPFVCTRYMELIMLSTLALAQRHHPIRIIGFVLMGNHIHLMVLVENPDDIAGFMERFKTESSHAVNHLLGRRQRTVWCEGYDSPAILTKEDLFRKLKYIYTNPSEAGLVHSIAEYPGLSSWGILSDRSYEREVLRVRRVMLKKLPKRVLNLKEQLAIAKEIESKGNERLTFKIEPHAWTECFPDRSPQTFDIALIKAVRKHEDGLSQNNKRKVIGETRLRLEPFFKAHTPKKFSPRMWCICSDVSLRTSFIALIKHLREKAIEVLKRWRIGDASVPFPVGLFPPRFPRLANALPPYVDL